jgi:S-adenosylmethionine:tRNA ribosyltransferase-isomerase
VFDIKDYDYDLPEALIAQHPVACRDQSRLMALDRRTGKVSHHGFVDLIDLLDPKDLLVVNDTEVVPGRLLGHKETGGKVEVLILDYAAGIQHLRKTGAFVASCMVRASKGLRAGATLFLGNELNARVLDGADGLYTLRFDASEDFNQVLYRIGHVPLPPYIHRDAHQPPGPDRQRYQTVYATQRGAIAAPTAGLHFTNDLLERIRAKGIGLEAITLHVGYGTFLPVRVADIREHRMHAESFFISEAAAAAIHAAKARGGRVVAVGTTSVRTLEYAADAHGRVKPGNGACDLFIYPGYRFNVVDAMVTNFHLPKSTLMMLISAFAGRETVLSAYARAVAGDYRFFSYGDAMFIS